MLHERGKGTVPYIIHSNLVSCQCYALFNHRKHTGLDMKLMKFDLSRALEYADWLLFPFEYFKGSIWSETLMKSSMLICVISSSLYFIELCTFE